MEEKNCLALYIAYYLARFNNIAYKKLGYINKTSAHKELAKKLGIKSTTLKNMRDEFDPIFGHRKGWHQRPMIPSRIKVLQSLEDLDEPYIFNIIESILNDRIIFNSEIHNYLLTLVNQDSNIKYIDGKFIPRGPTGKAAEEYFIHYYKHNRKPVNGKLIDFREYGSGYDFKIISNNIDYFIEVKGLFDKIGGISFTDKEWKVASKEKDRYFIVLIQNLKDKPEIKFVRNPFKVLNPHKHIYTSIQINWSVSIKELSNYGQLI